MVMREDCALASVPDPKDAVLVLRALRAEIELCVVTGMPAGPGMLAQWLRDVRETIGLIEGR